MSEHRPATLRERLGTVTDLCRVAVARYQRLDRSPRPGATALYWCEGLGRPLGRSLALRLRGRSAFAQNFGDALSPLIVSLLTGRPVSYTPGPGKLIALGSVFFALRDRDTVWGAGIGRLTDAKYAKTARNVTYAAVRGPRTRHALQAYGIDCPEVFGDPAMLLPRYVANDVTADAELGIIPHWTHFAAITRRCRDPRVRVIDVLDPVDVVARRILACRSILSTSLHGLILAEAYGIPAMLMTVAGTPQLNATKFADYFESTDRDLFVRHTGAGDFHRLSREIPRVPRPRFHLEPLLAAFPGQATYALTQPVTSWRSLKGRGSRQLDSTIEPLGALPAASS